MSGGDNGGGGGGGSKGAKAWKSLLFPLSLSRTPSASPSRTNRNSSGGEWGAMEEAVTECRRCKNVTSPELAKHLRFLESFTEASDFVYRERWTNRLTALGIVPVLMEYWPKFWAKDFINEAGQDESASLPVRINFVYSMKILWYGTQVSSPMTAAFHQQNGVGLFLESLKKAPLHPDSLQRNPFALYVLAGLLNILANVLAVQPGAVKDFLAKGGYRAVQPLQNQKEANLKEALQILLALLLSEEDDHEMMPADDLDHKFLANQLQLHLEAEPRLLEDEYFAQLILQALTLIASSSDRLKARIVKNGFLSVASGALKDFREANSTLHTRGLIHTLKLVWQLAFLEDNRERLLKKKSLLANLERLKNSEISEVSQSSQGILWMLEEKSEESSDKGGDRERTLGRSRSSDPVSEPVARAATAVPRLLNGDPPRRAKSARFLQVAKSDHDIVISHGQRHRPLALQLKHGLEAGGWHVWMEINGIKSLAKTTEAIGTAKAVVVIVSREFKESPRCRMEAEAAKRAGKKMVFLRAEAKYQPGGWLGSLVGRGEAVVDARSEMELSAAMPRIMKILRQIEEKEMPVPVIHSEKAGSGPKEGGWVEWTERDTRKWIATLRLSSDVQDLFRGFRGSDLSGLRKMYLKAPNAYYRTLSDLPDMTVLDLVRFTDALEGLK